MQDQTLLKYWKAKKIYLNYTHKLTCSQNMVISGKKTLKALFCSSPNMPPLYVCLSSFCKTGNWRMRNCLCLMILDASDTLLPQSENIERLLLLSIFGFTTVVSGNSSQDAVIMYSETNPALKNWQSVSSSVGG